MSDDGHDVSKDFGDCCGRGRRAKVQLSRSKKRRICSRREQTKGSDGSFSLRRLSSLGDGSSGERLSRAGGSGDLWRESEMEVDELELVIDGKGFKLTAVVS